MDGDSTGRIALTITPRLFLINDPLPALGKLVRPVEVEKVDPIVAWRYLP